MENGKVTYILLNGPASCGKSTIAGEMIRHLTHKNIRCKRDEIAGPVKKFIANLLGLPYSSIKKDEINSILSETPRRFLINLIEDYLKENYGDDFLSRTFIYRNNNFDGVVIADDCGFDTELEIIPRAQSFIIRVLRPGFTFANDSRNYVDDFDRKIINDLDLNKAFHQARDMVEYIVEKYRIKPMKDKLYDKVTRANVLDSKSDDVSSTS